MSAKHTPGPWAVVDSDTKWAKWANHCIWPVIMGRAVPVSIAKIPKGSDEARANAHLIAAAPDLLAALQGILRVADRKTDEFDAARAAIAKALGETT